MSKRKVPVRAARKIMMSVSGGSTRRTSRGRKRLWRLLIRLVYSGKRPRKRLSGRGSESLVCFSARMRGRKGENSLTGREASNSPVPVVKPVVPPVSGLRKGETPQQYVARTVELDLGDF